MIEDSQSRDIDDSRDTLGQMIDRVYRLDSEEQIQEIKLAHIKPVAAKNQVREQSEPSYREVIETLELLREKMGPEEVEKVINSLYSNLVTAKEVDNDGGRGERDRILKGWEDLMEASEVEVPPILTREYGMRPLVKKRKFLREQDQLRYRQKRIVAKALVDREYGLTHLQAEIVQSKSLIIIKRHRYTDIAYAVVTEGYRHLEHFLMNECKRSIKPSDKYEVGALHKILCNCRLLLRPEDSLTFLKFVQIAFSLQSVTVNEEAAVRLYISLQKEIRARVGNKRLDCTNVKRRWTKYLNLQKRSLFSQEDFNAFLTSQVEEESVRKYLETPEVSKLKTYLCEKYPAKSHLLTLESVRGIICKVVRIMIKRIFYYCEKYQELPQLIGMDSSYRGRLSKGAESLSIRLKLLRLWKKKEHRALKRIPAIVGEINSFIEQQQREKVNYVITKSKPNENVVDKLDFNINISRTKLTEGFKVASSNEIVLRGTEQNFEHYVNTENGKNLHYYRKIGHSFIQTLENSENIKIEDMDSQSNSESEEESEESKSRGDCSSVGSIVAPEGEAQLNAENAEQVIKEWIERLNLPFFKSLI